MIEIKIKEENDIIICQSRWTDFHIKTYWTKDFDLIKATSGDKYDTEYDLSNKKQSEFARIQWHINRHRKELKKIKSLYC